jgi:membrane protein YdbS with pleckstrin-like domain
MSLPPTNPIPNSSTDEVLDAGTFQTIKEPRSGKKLALDGTWHQISPRYVISQFVQHGLSILLVAGVAIAGWMMWQQWWILLAAGALLVMELVVMVIMPRQARAIGYRLREDDLVFRKGILWQRIVAVPYGRMQLVDITHGPLDRAFGIAQLKMVTAAATTGVQIPGLRQDAAEALRDTLIEVAETRRTGL